ncbi:acyltransferase family protein [Cryobacterium sp. PAMC25264]|uniref:acyltransferase family protein n=1 Tax=Cryobacterium sp. PAMC25264 TaxID=2861288 RepID=UPI001C63670F|nr:acyltransferase family protein [Cryobacterium sp. PAMC25264]QYF75487.1 acetyltransferase [Cryobacterium sp. PAMC25264]
MRATGAEGVTGPGRRRLSGLDGLRGLAVAFVVVYHLFPPALRGGFIGVDIFFVISGFLITGLIVAEQGSTGRFSPRRFWLHRARRLIPALVPLVLVACTTAWLIGGDVLVGLGWKLLGTATFSYNWVSLTAHTSYFDSGQPELFRNLWSLAVEEQFYLLWPLILLLLLRLRRPGLRLALVAALALASAVWMGIGFQPGSDPTRVYYGSDTHSFGLLIGACLALLLRPRTAVQGAQQSAVRANATIYPQAGAPDDLDPDRVPVRRSLAAARPWWGAGAVAGLLAAAIWLPDNSATTYRGGLLLVSLLSAVVIWAAIADGRFGRMLDSAPLRYLGERSYGLYLWHWPLLVLVQLWAPVGVDPWNIVGTGLITLVLALTAAALSYRWLETPIRRLGLRGALRRLRAWAPRPTTAPLGAGPVAGVSQHRRPRATLVGVAVATVLLVAGTAASVITAPAMTSAQTEVLRGQQALDRAAEAAEAQAAAAAAAQAAGVAAEATRGSTITAVGDSVMLASAAELQAEFPGIAIDAQVSRGMDAAPEILAAQRDAGTLRPVVVVGLGTNGPITASELADIMRSIGPSRELIVVNAFAERDWTAGVNAELADFSAHRARVALADWSAAIAPHVDVLADDGIHPGPTGGAVYADAVAAALDSLADAPEAPVPGPDTLQAFRPQPR